MPPLEQASPPGLRALGMRDRAPCRCPTPQLCLGRGGWVQVCAVRAGAPTSKRETRKGALGGHLLNLLSSPLSSLLILIHSHPPLSPQHSLAILNSAATDAEAEAQLGLQLEQVSRQVRGREGEREGKGLRGVAASGPRTSHPRAHLPHTYSHPHPHSARTSWSWWRRWRSGSRGRCRRGPKWSCGWKSRSRRHEVERRGMDGWREG